MSPNRTCSDANIALTGDMRVLLVIVVFILSACQPVESTVKPALKKQEDHQTSQRDTDQDHQATDNEVKYPPNSHIREKDIQSALENLAEQETPIGVKDKIDRERQDLKAQKSMADYTLGMLLLGIPTLIVSIVGVWAIIATLKQTKDALGIASAANTAADKAADAAVASVKITRDMGVAQTRAYVAINWGGLIWLKGGVKLNAKGEISLNGNAMLENVGNTPAYSVQAYLVKTKVFVGNTVIFESNADHVESIVFHGTLANKSKSTNTTNMTSIKKKSEKGFPDNCRYVLTFRCEYTDVFETRWFTEETFTGKMRDNDYVFERFSYHSKHGPVKT